MTGTSVGCLDGDSCGWEVIGTDNERREAFVMVVWADARSGTAT
jgi:hypothetical protein